MKSGSYSYDILSNSRSNDISIWFDSLCSPEPTMVSQLSQDFSFDENSAIGVGSSVSQVGPEQIDLIIKGKRPKSSIFSETKKGAL